MESREQPQAESNETGRKPREGWAEQLHAMAEAGDDKMLDEDTPTIWDKEEWEWETQEEPPAGTQTE